MKKRMLVRIFSLILLIAMLQLHTACEASNSRYTRYIGEYFVPINEIMFHHGDSLKIFEIKDNYVKFDYQNYHSGHATVYTANTAAFTSACEAEATGTVAYADTPDVTNDLRYKLTFCSDRINLQVYNDDNTLWHDIDFYRQNNYVSSQYDGYNSYNIAIGNYFISETDNKLTVVDLKKQESTCISASAYSNFISNGNYLYYTENDNVYEMNLKNKKTEYLFSADNIWLRDCYNNHLLYEFSHENSDDPTASVLALYNISNNTSRIIASYVSGIGFSNGNIVYCDQTGDYAPVNLYIYNTYKDDVIKISSLALPGDIYVDNDRIYYAEATNSTDWIPSFQVKTCNGNGKDKATLTDIIYDKYAVDITSAYVVCDNDNNKERVYYAVKPPSPVGKIYSTDIRAFINGIEIPSYSIDGKTVFIVEDVFSKHHTYEDSKRLLSFHPFTYDLVGGKNSYTLPIGTPIGEIFSSDITTIIGNTTTNVVPCYSLNGKMAVAIEDIGDGNFKGYETSHYWDPNARTISLMIFDV